MTRRHSPKITMLDVAHKANVSTATVSRFINNTGPVSEPVAHRIAQVMDELKYVPHAGAQHLASQKTMVVGLLLWNMHNDFFGPLLYGIESTVRENGYNLLVASCRADQNTHITPPIGPHNTDGLLVFADGLSDSDLCRLSAANFPLVLIHRTSPEGTNIPYVTVENKAATAELIRHLIQEHNRRRIVFIRGPENQEDSVWREMGYKEALAENGIEFDEDLIISGEFERDIANQAMKNFIDRHRTGTNIGFDAVFAGDDDAAIGVIQALKEYSLRIPDDIAVVGFDDSRLSAFLDPPLTTVRAPTYDVGCIAAINLFQMLDDQPVENATLLPTEIILRHSCGCLN
jgi:LacI family transcriptional regulator